ENNAAAQKTEPAAADTTAPSPKPATATQPNDPVAGTGPHDTQPPTVESAPGQTHEPSPAPEGESSAGRPATPETVPAGNTTEPPTGSGAPDQVVNEAGPVPDEVSSTKVDELRERAESAKNEAIDNRNDIAELQREI